MQKDLIKIVKCPECGASDLSIYPFEEDLLDCTNGKITEVKKELIVCKCNRYYKIEDYIPQFIYVNDPNFIKQNENYLTNISIRKIIVNAPTENQENSIPIKDGEYWGEYYEHLFLYNILNFVDIQEDYAPFYQFGIFERISKQFKGEFRKKYGIPDDSKIFINDEYNLVINNKMVNNFLHEGSIVLEIGCGSGWLSLELKRKGFKVIGIDPSIQCLKVAKNYAIKKHKYIEYFQADAGKLPFEKDVFDGIFAYHSLHHIPNLLELGTEIRNISKEGAIISIYEYRKNTILFKITEYFCYFWRTLIIKRLYKQNSDFQRPVRGSSLGEDISIKEIDNFLELFDLKEYETYFHFLYNIPILSYFTFKKKEKFLFYSYLLCEKIIYLIEKILPNYSEFCFAVGYTKKE